MIFDRIGVLASSEQLAALTATATQHGFDVYGLWSENETTTKDVAAAHNITLAASTVDELLLHKEVEAFIVCCSPAQQVHVVVKALGIGKHVVSTTLPTALCVEHAERMLDASQYYPQLLSGAILGLRHSTTICEMKNALSLHRSDFGTINTIKFNVTCNPLHNACGSKGVFDRFCDVAGGGGALFLVGVPLLDCLLHFFPKLCIESVTATVRSMETEDVKTFQTSQPHRLITADNFVQATLYCRGEPSLVLMEIDATLDCNQRSGNTQPFNLTATVNGSKTSRTFHVSTSKLTQTHKTLIPNVISAFEAFHNGMFMAVKQLACAKTVREARNVVTSPETLYEIYKIIDCIRCASRQEKRLTFSEEYM